MSLIFEVLLSCVDQVQAFGAVGGSNLDLKAANVMLSLVPNADPMAFSIDFGSFKISKQPDYARATMGGGFTCNAEIIIQKIVINSFFIKGT